MSKTIEKYPTVADLRAWIEQNGIPDNWELRRSDYGLSATDPSTNGMISAGFSLVPEDVEDE